MIELRNVNKSFPDPYTEVLKGIDLTVHDGEFLCIEGKSGAGKSTLLYVMSSLDHPSSGEVLLNGESLTKLTPRQLHRFRNLQIGFVFQSHYLLPELNALENVLLPAHKTKQSREKTDYAKELLLKFDIAEDRFSHYPSQLSGGEQQRVTIARALVMQPKIVFADEPTGDLDTENSEIVMNLLKSINRDLGTTIVFVTHDPDYAKLADRIVFVRDGVIVT